MDIFTLDTAAIEGILARGNSVEIRNGRDGIIVMEICKKACQRIARDK